MSRRTVVSFVAAAVVGIACLSTISTDALAYRGVGRVGVGRVGVGRVGVGVGRAGGVYGGAAVRRGVAVGVGAAAVGVGAYARPYCGYYPYPRCY
jgi:hypothetical protein